jgi:hypothetical protein
MARCTASVQFETGASLAGQCTAGSDSSLAPLACWTLRGTTAQHTSFRPALPGWTRHPQPCQAAPGSTPQAVEHSIDW